MDNIKIAVALDDSGPLGVVPEYFAGTGQLLLVESGPGMVREVVRREGAADVELARRILDWGCECVLCGLLEEAPFLIIADEGCVTRYNAAGLSLENALQAFRENELELIRDYIGGRGCQSAAEGLERECREHD